MRTHTVEGGAGLRLHVRDFGPAGAPAILLIHGWSQHHLCWSKQFGSDLASTFRIVAGIAASTRGHLSDAECAEWAARDLARGRRVREPAVGVAEGIASDGALLIRSEPSGRLRPHYAGSLVFDELPLC